MESSVRMFQILTNMIFAKFYTYGTEDSTNLENEQSWYLPIDSLSEMKIYQLSWIFSVFILS